MRVCMCVCNRSCVLYRESFPNIKHSILTTLRSGRCFNKGKRTSIYTRSEHTISNFDFKWLYTMSLFSFLTTDPAQLLASSSGRSGGTLFHVASLLFYLVNILSALQDLLSFTFHSAPFDISSVAAFLKYT